MQLTNALTPLRRLAGAALLALAALPVTAQGMFSPAITVNDDVITNYELEQRTAFLTLLRAPGDPAELARDQLIEDRLRQQTVTRAGIVLTPEQIDTGIAEFAERTSMSAERFTQALAESGIAAETLRDFVSTSIAWREYIRQKYLDQVRPTPAEVDRALATDATNGGIRVNLAEIIIPVTPENQADAEQLAQQITTITSYDEFSEVAARFSASESRENGGRLGWLALNTLPAPLRPILLGLEPRQISQPVPLPNAIALFQLRGLDEIVPAPTTYSEIDYAAYYIPGGRSPEGLAAAARLRGEVDRCDDLYGIAKGQPPQVLERKAVAPSAIPTDIALELAKLDAGEVSTALTRNNGQTLVFLMMCSRTAAINAEATRDEATNAVISQKLARIAENELALLRADAVIYGE